MIDSTDSLIPGGRYHHRRDYMNFPKLNRPELHYKKINPLTIKGLSLKSSIIKAIDSKDYLINTPYHTFSYVIKFLRESALDPEVKLIKITIYRLSKISNVVSSLINAARNGKKVQLFGFGEMSGLQWILKCFAFIVQRKIPTRI